jgi:hypothetical protein
MEGGKLHELAIKQVGLLFLCKLSASSIFSLLVIQTLGLSYGNKTTASSSKPPALPLLRLYRNHVDPILPGHIVRHHVTGNHQ